MFVALHKAAAGTRCWLTCLIVTCVQANVAKAFLKVCLWNIQDDTRAGTVWFMAAPTAKSCFLCLIIFWKSAGKYIYIILYCTFKHMDTVCVFQCVSGSSDIQEDHSQEQCQEEEDVRGFHWNATAAHILRGETTGRPALTHCSSHFQ